MLPVPWWDVFPGPMAVLCIGTKSSSGELGGEMLALRMEPEKGGESERHQWKAETECWWKI